MSSCCFKAKFCIYALLIGHLLINIIFLFLLLISSYNFSILTLYQKIYLVISIIIWIILSLYSVIKLFAIILGKFSIIFSPKRLWKLIHIPAYIIIGIAAIYDLVKIPETSGTPGVFIYYLLALIIYAIFIISAQLDLKGIQSQIDLSENKMKFISLKEEHENSDNSKKIN